MNSPPRWLYEEISYFIEAFIRYDSGIRAGERRVSRKEKDMPQVTFRGEPLTLAGKLVEAGQKAPDFAVVDTDLTPRSLADYKGRAKLISVVPSLDTAVCALQTQTFEERAKEAGEKADIITVSLDLPFAQKRWSNEHEAKHITFLSDYKTRSFGDAYGLLIDELKLLARAVLVVDADDTVRYVQLVGEVTDQPDYDAAFAALKAVTG